MINKKNTTGKRSKYAAKKERMKNGTYEGNSPFYTNIPEFQYLRTLNCYPHLRESGMVVGRDMTDRNAA